MTVYVDDWRQQARVGRINARWSHLIVAPEGDLEELHAFAAQIGLRRTWFQDKPWPRAHYDVTESKRQQAIAAGATPITWREAGQQMLQAARERNTRETRQATATPAQPTPEPSPRPQPASAPAATVRRESGGWAETAYGFRSGPRTCNDPHRGQSGWQVSQRTQDAGNGHCHDGHPLAGPLCQTTARRLADAGISPDDPALAALRQWNAAALARRADREAGT
jgi:hypothetical protein